MKGRRVEPDENGYPGKLEPHRVRHAPQYGIRDGRFTAALAYRPPGRVLPAPRDDMRHAGLRAAEPALDPALAAP